VGGILKRSLGMAFHNWAMPKGCAFEPATHLAENGNFSGNF
jgi:hypothetical protein